jgi:hypothetical protein
VNAQAAKQSNAAGDVPDVLPHPAAAIEFRIETLRFWLVTFKRGDAEEAFYAVVLPDGTENWHTRV